MVIAAHRWYDRVSGCKTPTNCIKDSSVVDTVIDILVDKYSADNYIVYSEYYKQYKSKYKIDSSLANKVINTCERIILKEGENTVIAM